LMSVPPRGRSRLKTVCFLQPLTRRGEQLGEVASGSYRGRFWRIAHTSESV
jgi:hypothetical protein